MLHVKLILNIKKITITEAAERCGVGRSFLSQVVHGHRPPSKKIIERLPAFLGVSPDHLFAEINEYQILGSLGKHNTLNGESASENFGGIG